MRVGWGFDAHRFSPEGEIRLGGVVVDQSRGLDATSDGDVLAHALTDALLGAAALGDLGSFYPSSDPQWTDADSMGILADAVRRVSDVGLVPYQIDVTVVAEHVRVAPYRDAIRQSLAEVLGLELTEVSVKATSTDQLGFLGRDEGLAVVATAVLT
jgi:2-C-methyl-D-erythritol 2,4-cyclodiphosphate synthase